MTTKEEPVAASEDEEELQFIEQAGTIEQKITVALVLMVKRLARIDKNISKLLALGIFQASTSASYVLGVRRKLDDVLKEVEEVEARLKDEIEIKQEAE